MQQPNEPVFHVDVVSLIRLISHRGLAPKDIKFFTRLKRRMQSRGFESIGEFSDLVFKRKRSKPLGFGKVDSVKLTP